MFRLWAKKFKDSHIICDMVVNNSDSSMTRTKKIFAALDEYKIKRHCCKRSITFLGNVFFVYDNRFAGKACNLLF